MAAFPRRYGIYFADLNPTVGGELRKVRPVVVVSQNERNRLLDTVVVCPLTSWDLGQRHEASRAQGVKEGR